MYNISQSNSYSTFFMASSQEDDEPPIQNVETQVTTIALPLSKRILNQTKLVAVRIGLFLRDNWKKIVLYLLTWLIIIGCYGALCGFECVALPFTIWMSIGFGLGFIFGIITATLLDPKNKWNGKNSLWDLMNLGLLQLDPNGTRQVLLAVVITAISTSLVVFPQVLGAFLGFCAGNQLGVKMCYGIKLGTKDQLLSPKKSKEIKEYEEARTTHSLIKENLILKKHNLELQHRMDLLEARFSNMERNQTTDSTEEEPNVTIETNSRTTGPITHYSERILELNNRIKRCNVIISGLSAYLNNVSDS
ncbi:MAG: hypothetical protein RR796_03995 [Victivallaceae bacterium]